MLRASRLILLAVAFSSACGGDTTSAPSGPSVGSPQEARQYVESVLNLMQAHSINRLTIDWNSFRASVLAEAASAQKIGDTYPALRTALRLLGDGHSFLQVPGGGVIYVPTRSCGAPQAATPTLPDGVGYVRVGSFGGSGGAAVAFADGIQEAIRNADRDDLVGWIVDLRGKGGGNMWPMIAGVGPVLGEGVLGYFIDPVGGESGVWEYRAGASRLDGSTQVRTTSVYTLRRPAPRVAVLTDVAVGSSGEAVAVAFRLRPDTRSFGAATCGLSTANRSFQLIDDSVLFLTVSLMADRGRNRYGVPLVPDELVDADQVVQRAVDWLQMGR